MFSKFGGCIVDSPYRVTFFLTCAWFDLKTNDQTDARAAQDSLMEALEILSAQTCGQLLTVNDTPNHTAGSVWSALHAVRRSFHGAIASGVDEGSRDGALGFDEKVKRLRFQKDEYSKVDQGSLDDMLGFLLSG